MLTRFRDWWDSASEPMQFLLGIAVFFLLPVIFPAIILYGLSLLGYHMISAILEDL